MSWSLSITNTEPSEVETALKAAKDNQLAYQPFDSWDDDVETQIDAMIEAATRSVSLMREDKKINVSVAGHAEAKDGKGTSMVSFNVSESYVPPPAPAKKEK